MPSDLNPIVIIPSRLASTRLPNKPLADIGGVPMIVRVWRAATEANVGPVYVACGDEEIKETVEAAGGAAVMTDPDLPSGSDRVWAALAAIDPSGDYDVAINLQGDVPTIDPAIISAALRPLENPIVDIATLASQLTDPEAIANPNNVKSVCLFEDGATVAPTPYFSRLPVPHGDGPIYHHLGLYVYRRAALQRFVSLPPSPLEKRERLEQLRAIEAGMVIHSALVDADVLSVDTPEDLEQARALVAQREA